MVRKKLTKREKILKSNLSKFKKLKSKGFVLGRFSFPSRTRAESQLRKTKFSKDVVKATTIRKFSAIGTGKPAFNVLIKKNKLDKFLRQIKKK